MRGYLGNLWLLGAIALNLGLHACAVYLTVFQVALHTVPLAMGDWGLALALALPVHLIAELVKSRLAARHTGAGRGPTRS